MRKAPVAGVHEGVCQLQHVQSLPLASLMATVSEYNMEIIIVLGKSNLIAARLSSLTFNFGCVLGCVERCPEQTCHNI
jgi:hypothetical protein